MGDFLVLSIIFIIVATVVFNMIKNKKKGISIACSSCHVVKSCSKDSCELPSWVAAYKENANH